VTSRTHSESAAPATDPLLLPLLRAASWQESDTLLEQLIRKYAEPVIREIVNFKLRVCLGHKTAGQREDEAEDLFAEIVVRLLDRLHQLKEDPANKGIVNLRSYVAVTAYNSCDEFLRRKYPLRHSLKNKLRYLLTHREGLALWEADDERWLCGFSRWVDQRQQTRSHSGKGSLSGIRNIIAEDLNGPDPLALLAAIFERVGSPVEFDDLVNFVADLWGIKDRQESSELDTSGEGAALISPVDPGLNPERVLEQRERLIRTWKEVCELPERQRVALLLNLRDSSGLSIVALLPRVRIATIREIAATLGMCADELAALWEDLPFEDSRIAELLSITRQQVINLRKSARARLVRRLIDD